MTANWFDAHWFNLLLIPGILIGFTIHELGHALVAYHLGDYSQVKEGRISANPFRHISWVGIVFVILTGFGFPKLIRFEPKAFKDRYLDSYLVAVAGPGANFVAALIIFLSSALLVGLLNLTQVIEGKQAADILFFNRANPMATLKFNQAVQDVSLWVIAFSNRLWVANFMLGVISLLPLPPFDGFTILLSFVGMLRERRLKELTQQTAGQPTRITPRKLKAKPVYSQKKNVADIHFEAGTAYHQQGQFDDAIARYRQAIRLDESHGPSYVNMGLAYRAKHQREEAIQALRAATRLAADEKSRNQAWAELHSLSILPGVRHDHNGQDDGVEPWTDVNPSPDWLSFSASAATLLLSFICIFGVLLLSMISGYK
jgi:Zn-dependent protease